MRRQEAEAAAAGSSGRPENHSANRFTSRTFKCAEEARESATSSRIGSLLHVQCPAGGSILARAFDGIIRDDWLRRSNRFRLMVVRCVSPDGTRYASVRWNSPKGAGGPKGIELAMFDVSSAARSAASSPFP